MLGVTLSKDARARAIQLPAWNEALGLPRPWDQQWSLRMQQVLAYESDLLEYDDLFAGSVVVEAKVAELVAGAKAEMARVEEMGGAVAAVESGYMKSALVASHAERRRRIEAGEAVVVGLNRFETTEPNPLTADLDTAIQTVDADVERHASEAVRRVARDARRRPRAPGAGGGRDGAPARRRRFGRQPHGGLARVRPRRRSRRGSGPRPCASSSASTALPPASPAPSGVGSSEPGDALSHVRELVARTGEELGEKLRILVGKPGLDGHSNGAEQVAVRARDAGFEVVYQGIRLTPEQIVAAAVAEDVHLVGISILSGSHMELVPEVLRGLREAGAGDVPVIVGGIIPESDAAALRAAGVAMVFTPKDFGLNDIMGEMVGVIRAARGLAPLESAPA